MYFSSTLNAEEEVSFSSISVVPGRDSFIPPYRSALKIQFSNDSIYYHICGLIEIESIFLSKFFFRSYSTQFQSSQTVSAKKTGTEFNRLT